MSRGGSKAPRNVGAAVTTFLAPLVMVAFGWPTVAQVWATSLALMALIFWFTTADDPVQRARRAQRLPALTLRQQLAPLANAQVWRFSLYNFFVFGGFVALALWLPRFYRRLSFGREDGRHIGRRLLDHS
jgi:MFS transporter, NNP family, nitrate/nitrite transporter